MITINLTSDQHEFLKEDMQKIIDEEKSFRFKEVISMASIILKILNKE